MDAPSRVVAGVFANALVKSKSITGLYRLNMSKTAKSVQNPSLQLGAFAPQAFSGYPWAHVQSSQFPASMRLPPD